MVKIQKNNLLLFFIPISLFCGYILGVSVHEAIKEEHTLHKMDRSMAIVSIICVVCIHLAYSIFLFMYTAAKNYDPCSDFIKQIQGMKMKNEKLEQRMQSYRNSENHPTANITIE